MCDTLGGFLAYADAVPLRRCNLNAGVLTAFNEGWGSAKLNQRYPNPVIMIKDGTGRGFVKVKSLRGKKKNSISTSLFLFLFRL